MRSYLLQQLHELDCSLEEEFFRSQMINLLHLEENCFYRNCFPSHFTGSALVVSKDGQEVLLTHHKFLNKWLQFGGHCDGEELVLNVALRETREESGIHELTPVFEKPFDIDIHSIPVNSKKNEPEHFHYDIRYVFRAASNSEFIISEESNDLKWFPIKELPICDKGLIRFVKKWENYLSDNSINDFAAASTQPAQGT